MGKAGKTLRQVLDTYNISQNKLAVTMKVRPSVIFRWFHEQTDPTAESVILIVKSLQAIKVEAADEFVRLYLGEFLNGHHNPDHIQPSQKHLGNFHKSN